MMKLFFTSAMICGSMLVLPIVGCNETVHSTIQGRNDPYEGKQIQFSSEDLRRATAVSPPIVARDDSGNLFVTVPIRSAVDHSFAVDYRTTFFDRNGQPILTTGWFTKHLEKNTPDRITVNSVTPRATDFEVDFRFAK